MNYLQIGPHARGQLQVHVPPRHRTRVVRKRRAVSLLLQRARLHPQELFYGPRQAG